MTAVAAKEAFKTYTLPELGEGKQNGGGAKFHKARCEAMERIRAVAHLSPEQMNDWKLFKTHWDKTLGSVHNGEWAGVFAEMLEQVLEDLIAGKPHALSEFMHKEMERVLATLPTLKIPGCQ